MKKPLLALFTVISLVLPLLMSAQSATISGVITDKSGPVFGAQVYLQNKDERIVQGTVTGPQGEYLLNVPSNASELMLCVSYVGMKTVAVAYTGQKTFNRRLEEDSKVISTVEVIGVGAKKDVMGINKSDLGTASEELDVTQFEDMSVTSIEDMIQGKLANVDIVAASGDPGTAATIRIRGSASLNASNEPLIVIDGVPQDNEIDPEFDFGDATVENFSALVNMSPNDIQSIEVLKDAAATTLWGPKAANGVLLITTKQGGNHKPRFSLNQKFSYVFEPQPIKVLNGKEYTTLMQDAMWNWIKDGNFASARMNKLEQSKEILYDRFYLYYDEFNCDTDWISLITQNQMNSTTDFSMDGGGEKASYRFSVGYEDSESTIRNAPYQRITSRLNLNYKFSKKFTAQSLFSYAESSRNSSYIARPQDTDDVNLQNNSVRNTALIAMPNMSPWVLSNGKPTDEYFNQEGTAINQTVNTLAIVNESSNLILQRDINANFSTQYQLGKGFLFNGQVAFGMKTMRINSFYPASAEGSKASSEYYNRGSEALTNNTSSMAQFRLNYNKSFNRIHRIVLAGNARFNTTNSNYYMLTTSGNGAKQVSSPLSGGKLVSHSGDDKLEGVRSNDSRVRTINVSGTFLYSFKERYVFNIGGSSNASSSMSPDRRFNKIRPSMTFAWKMQNDIFKKVKWVKEARLKGSWGISERLPEASSTMGTLSAAADYMNLPTIKLDKLQLDKLLPETVEAIDFGFDATLLKSGDITLGVEVYDKTTTNLLQKDTQVQSSIGYNSLRWKNMGSMQNYGWEFMFSYNNIFSIGKAKFSLSNFNISRNRNRLITVPSNMEAERYSLTNGNYAKRLIEGNPFGSIYGYKFLGIYQNYDETLARDASGNYIRDINNQPVVTKIGRTQQWQQRAGDAKYADLNYDGVIDQYDMIYLGNSYPIVTGGATFRINYGQWMVRVSTHFRVGQSIINMAKLNTETMGGENGWNQSKRTLNRWRYEGDKTDIPRALWGKNYNSLGSDKYVENGDFLKCKDLTVNYRFKPKFTQKLGISRASVSLTTYNIFTITNYSGQDPEIAPGNGAYALATDNSRTPPLQRIALSIAIDF